MKVMMAALVLLAAAGCSRNEGPVVEDKTGTTSQEADNTKRNERDTNTNAVTATDQGENETDRTITQQIRREVTKDDDLSMDGKNVKIITVDGVVTLRGPVKTAEERTEIANVAQRVEGVKRVDNQLEIAAK